MWEVRAQFNKPSAEGNSTNLEWSSVLVDTEAEADSWWRCRVAGKCVGRVSTLFDPAGNVVRVAFN